MSLQFEDMIVDCLQELYPNYDLVFIFDHTTRGHACQQCKHLLSAQQMLSSYREAQPRERDKTIMTDEGSLSPINTMQTFSLWYFKLMMLVHVIYLNINIVVEFFNVMTNQQAKPKLF